MKGQIFRLVHVVLIALIGTFAEFAPVSGSIDKYAFFVAFGIGAIKILYDFVLEVKKGNYLNRNLIMAITSSCLMILGFYLQVIVAIIVFLSIGMIGDYLISKRSKRAENLSGILPKEVTVFVNGDETKISIEELEIGRIVVVENGQIIPADGRIFRGKAKLELSFLTGSRRTVDVDKDDHVYGGAINRGETIQVEITSSVEESIFSQMINKAQNAMNDPDEFSNKIGLISKGISILFIISGIIVSIAPPIIGGYEYGPWIYRGMLLLMAASFDRITGIVNISITSLIYDLFFDGILTNRKSLYDLDKTTGILLERSQRFAEGTYKISHIHEDGKSKEELITLAAHLEYFSDHIIAKTIVDGFIQVARYEGIVDINPVRINLVDNFEEIKGKGVTGNVAGQFVCVGNKKLMELLNIKNLPEEENFEVIYVAIDQVYCGYIALEYLRKPGVEDVYAAWSDSGITKYAVLDGKGDEITAQLRDEIADDEKIAYVGMDNHHGESDFADLSVIIDCYDNKLMFKGDIEMMDGSLTDVAIIKEQIAACFDDVKLKSAGIFVSKFLLYILSAIFALPLYMPMIIDGIIESIVLKKTYK